MTVDYTAEDRAEEKASGTLILHISRDPEERLAAQEAADTGETEEEETITAYLRVGDSQIVYQITSEDYQETGPGSTRGRKWISPRSRRRWRA